MNKYIHILVPNFCGSTLLHELLSSSLKTNTLPLIIENKKNIKKEDVCKESIYVEGIHFYKHLADYRVDNVKSIEGIMEHVLLDKKLHNWLEAKKTWDSIWDNAYNYAIYRVQKNPRDLHRVETMIDVFTKENTNWLIMNRDPYQHAFAISKRAYVNDVFPLEVICQHVCVCLKSQIKNVNLLGDTAINFSYEELTNNPELVKDKIVNFLPELHDIDIDRNFYVKDKYNPIKNMDLKLPDVFIRECSLHFKEYEKELEYWGYKLL